MKNKGKTKRRPPVFGARLVCPWCGGRDESEFCFVGFSYGGSEDRYTDFKWVNCDSVDEGGHYGLWQHRNGCRQWFNMEIDKPANDVLTSHTIRISRRGLSCYGHLIFPGNCY